MKLLTAIALAFLALPAGAQTLQGNAEIDTAEPGTGLAVAGTKAPDWLVGRWHSSISHGCTNISRFHWPTKDFPDDCKFEISRDSSGAIVIPSRLVSKRKNETVVEEIEGATEFVANGVAFNVRGTEKTYTDDGKIKQTRPFTATWGFVPPHTMPYCSPDMVSRWFGYYSAISADTYNACHNGIYQVMLEARCTRD